jgi:hypothetical protein
LWYKKMRQLLLGVVILSLHRTFFTSGMSRIFISNHLPTCVSTSTLCFVISFQFSHWLPRHLCSHVWRLTNTVAGSCDSCSTAWDVVAESKTDAPSTGTSHVCMFKLQYTYTKRCWGYLTSCEDKAQNQSSYQSLPFMHQV